MRAHKIRKISLILAVLVPLGLIAPQYAAARSAAAYTITDLGTLGGARSVALGINNRGEVVGYSTTSSEKPHAFLYIGGSLLDLGTLGGDDSYAYRISDSGLLIGRAQTSNGEHHAFISIIGSGLFDLSSLSFVLGTPFSTASSISDTGLVVGYTDVKDDRDVGEEHRGPHKRAFLYNDQNKIIDLGTFGGDDAIATAVNDSGQITGYYTKGNHGGPYVAFLFSGGNVINLGELGGNVPIPVDINNAGQVIGSVLTPSGEPHAFLYSGGLLFDLGTLPGGSQSLAYGINNLGQVVGATNSAAIALRAFIYDDGVMRDLNSLIPAESGWMLTEARDINDAGQIVGTGIIRGQQHAFILTPVGLALSSTKMAFLNSR